MSHTALPQDEGIAVELPTRSFFGRKTAVLAAVAATAGAAVCMSQKSAPAVAIEVPSVPLLEGESLEAFEALTGRQLVDPKERIHAVRSVDGKIIFNDKDLYDVQCSVDVLQSAAYLGQAVISIQKTLVYTDSICAEDNSHNSGCALQVELAVVVFMWLASYLSLAASSCAEAVNVEANCAADVTGLAACLAEAVFVGTALSLDCKFETQKFFPPLHPGILKHLSHRHLERLNGTAASDMKALENHVATDGRRLKAYSSKAELDTLVERLKVQKKQQTGAAYDPEVDMPRELKHLALEWKNWHSAKKQERLENNLDLAQCGMNAMQSVGYLIRSLKIILGTWNDGCDDGKVCAINILNVIACFSWMSQFTAAMFTDCTLNYNQEAACAADVSELVAVVTTMGAYFMVFDTDCQATVPGNTVSEKTVIEIEQGKRRLSEEEAEEE